MLISFSVQLRTNSHLYTGKKLNSYSDMNVLWNTMQLYQLLNSLKLTYNLQRCYNYKALCFVKIVTQNASVLNDVYTECFI